ncbi:hypothetical protein A2U01_0082035 [Trifolium medium]|uniref:Uncharacterized protein n=1 Tax=Trifolium medium TaxID=97028 RepID=A0A392THY6_9FABA|nr:hypothetical protein [Trifolium medium]
MRKFLAHYAQKAVAALLPGVFCASCATGRIDGPLEKKLPTSCYRDFKAYPTIY